MQRLITKGSSRQDVDQCSRRTPLRPIMLWTAVAMVIVAISHQCMGQGYNDDGERIWIVGIGHDWGAMEFFDQSGYIRGFSVDITLAVCEDAGLDCRTMWTPYSWCMDSAPGTHAFGGEGLVDSWIDACSTWFPTTDRVHIFDFSLPYIKPDQSYFFVKKGDTSFSAGDLAGKKIGFVSGWKSDEKCVARGQSDTQLNYVLGTDQMVYVDTVGELINLVVNGQVDAVFAGYGDLSAQVDDGTLDYKSENPLTCALDGAAMMSRKDNDFTEVWNQAFQSFKDSGKFAQLCADSQQLYAAQGQIVCVD